MRKHSRGAASLIARENAAHAAPFCHVEMLRFRGVPLLFAAVAFAGGIALARWWRPAAMLVMADALLLVVAAVAVWRAPRLMLGCTALVWMGLGWTCGVMRPRAVASVALLQYADGLRRDVVGRVVNVRQFDMPRGARAGEDPLGFGERAGDQEAQAESASAVSVDLEVQGVEEVTPDRSTIVPAKGGARVAIYGPANALPRIECGQQLRVTTRLRAPQEFRDPGVWRYPDYLADQGVSASGTAVVKDVFAGAPGPATTVCRLARLRHWAGERVLGFARWEHRLPGLHGFHVPPLLQWSAQDVGVINAMLFGDRTLLDRGLKVQFERTGTFHLFVVAGMHVAIVAGGLVWLMGRLRVPGTAAVLIALAGTAGYALLTGFGAPVQRALVMTAAYMLTRVLSRERNVLNAIGMAALVMLVLRPQTLFESSFQMTVLVALTLGGMVAPMLARSIGPYAHGCRQISVLRLDQHAPPRVAQFRVTLRMAGEALSRVVGDRVRGLPALGMRILLGVGTLALLSLATEMVMALPMAVYFHRVTPLALPANLLVVPMLPLVMAGAIATFLLALVSPWLAVVPGAVTAALLHWTSLVIRGVGALRTADWRIATPPGAAIAAVLVMVAFCLVLLRGRRGPAWVGVVLVPCIFGVVLLPYRPRLHAGTLEVTAIDVGQGDSILMAGPEGGTMLVDAGGQVGAERAERRAAFDIGEEVVAPYLWSRGVRRLDVVALTHAHMDHLGGMAAVLRDLRPRELWISVEPDSEVLRALLAEAGELGIPVRHLHAGDAVAWSGTEIRVLSPGASYAASGEATNDDSLVMRVEYGEASALLAGDAERVSEEQMLRDGAMRPVTLLKVGHHGSNSSTTEELVERLRPRAAVISCGRGNRFGHPRMPVLQRLQGAGVATARTDTMGAVQYLLHGDGSIETHILASNSD